MTHVAHAWIEKRRDFMRFRNEAFVKLMLQGNAATLAKCAKKRRIVGTFFEFLSLVVRSTSWVSLTCFLRLAPMFISAIAASVNAGMVSERKLTPPLIA